MKQTIKICLFNPAKIRSEEIIQALKDLPIRIIPCFDIDTIVFIDTMINVKNYEEK